MFKVHTSDGSTIKMDLEDEEQAQRWMARMYDPHFQAQITGVTITHKGVQYSLSKPQGFSVINYIAEYIETESSRKIKGGERIVCFAGDMRVSMMVHKEQRAARISLTKIGKQRYNPLQDMGKEA